MVIYYTMTILKFTNYNLNITRGLFTTEEFKPLAECLKDIEAIRVAMEIERSASPSIITDVLQTHTLKMVLNLEHLQDLIKGYKTIHPRVQYRVVRKKVQ